MFDQSVQRPTPSARVRVLPLLCVAATAVLIFYVFVAVTTIGPLLDGQPRTDYVSFYAAGVLVRQGHGAALYDYAMQTAVQRASFDANFIPNAYPLPAFVAFLLAPLTALSFVAGALVLFAANIALIGVLARAGWRYLAGVPHRALLVVCAAVSMPAFLVVLRTQFDLVVLASIVGCFTLIRRDRPFTAGAVLALALVKPHLVAAVVLLLLMKRAWPVLAGLATVGLPLLLAPVAVFGLGILRDQLALIASYPGSSSEHSVAAYSMVNVRGAITSIFDPANPLVWAIPLALIAGVSLASAMRVWSRRTLDDPQSWALALMLPVLYSPHVHVWSVSLTVGACILYARARADAGAPVGRESILAAFVLVAFMWLLGLTGLALMCVPLTAAFAVIVVRWPRTEQVTSQAAKVFLAAA